MSATSKYKYVRHKEVGHRTNSSGLRYTASLPWEAKLDYRHALGVKTKSKRFATEREAAIQVDKWLLEMGREPVNILKRK